MGSEYGNKELYLQTTYVVFHLEGWGLTSLTSNLRQVFIGMRFSGSHRVLNGVRRNRRTNRKAPPGWLEVRENVTLGDLSSQVSFKFKIHAI